MSDPIVEIPNDYTSDMSLNEITSHLSTLYTYGAKCNSVREIGPSGMFSSGAVLYGVLQYTDPATALTDISINVIEEMSSTTNRFYDITNAYPDVNYKSLRIVRPTGPEDNADMYFVPIWHLTEDGTNLFTNSMEGTVNLVDRIKEYSEYTNKYLIIHQKNVISVDRRPIDPADPTSPTEQTYISCIDPMASHAERLGITVDTIRENIWNTIQAFVLDNPSWSVVKRFQDGSWVTILEKTV